MERLGIGQPTIYSKINQFCYDIITRTFFGGGAV